MSVSKHRLNIALDVPRHQIWLKGESQLSKNDFFNKQLATSHSLNGIGDLKRFSAGIVLESSVTTDTPYGFISFLSAALVPSTELRDAL